MKELKIIDLFELNELNEMATILLNHNVDNKFYDYYIFKDLSWLLENKKKIINDFDSNLKEIRFDILINSYNLCFEYGPMILKQILKEGKEELKKYINLDYITIDEAYNNLIAKKSDYARFTYFTRIKK